MRKPPIEKWVTWFLIISALVSASEKLITGLIRQHKRQQMMQAYKQRNNANSMRH